MLAALESVPLLPDLLIGAGLGSLLGALVAYRHDRRGGRIPRDWLVARWSAFIAGVALMISLLAELL